MKLLFQLQLQPQAIVPQNQPRQPPMVHCALLQKTGFLVDVEHEVKLDREWATPAMGFNEKKLIEFPIPKTFTYKANIDQLAEYTLRLLTNDSLREQMGKVAAEHALKNFHYKKTAKDMIDLIEAKLNAKI